MENDKKRLEKAIEKQIEIMAALRNPDGGCPWDLKQDFDTIAPYTVEEAYEVQDAIMQRDFNGLREELGDLVFQVAFHSRLAEEAGLFNFTEVVEGLNEKMVRRHPHVFGNQDIATPTEVLKNWEKLKAKEREDKLKGDNSVLAGIALPLPALTRAEKISKRAARVGFDWDNVAQIFDKLNEEVAETKEAIEENDPKHIEEELGDVLFVIVNLARKLKIDPEQALKGANAKFERRFRFIEDALQKDGKSPEDSNVDEMEKLWGDAKLMERSGI